MHRLTGTSGVARTQLSSSMLRLIERFERSGNRLSAGLLALTTLDGSCSGSFLYSDLPGTELWGHSDRGSRSHQPEARILETAALSSAIFATQSEGRPSLEAGVPHLFHLGQRLSVPPVPWSFPVRACLAFSCRIMKNQSAARRISGARFNSQAGQPPLVASSLNQISTFF